MKQNLVRGGVLLALLMGAVCPAFAATGVTRPDNVPLFFLVAFLCLFAYLIFNNFALQRRLERLQSEPRGIETGSSPLVSTFEWERVADRAPFPLFGSILPISRAGLYVVGVRSETMLTPVIANLLHSVLLDDSNVAMLVSQRAGRDELGSALLTLEAGAPWSGLGSEERTRVRRRAQSQFDRYESNLFLFEEMDWTADRLFSACQQLRDNDREIRAILLDDPVLLAQGELRCAEALARLQLLSVKCTVPIVLLTATRHQDARFWLNLGERFIAIFELVGPAADGRSVEMGVLKYPGEVPKFSLSYDAASGSIAMS